MIAYGGENFKELLTKKEFVLVDFFATWCGPCKMLMPVLEGVSKEREDVLFVKVDVDQHRELAKDGFDIKGVPTLILFKDGEPLARKSGFMTKEMVNQWLDANI